MKEFEDWEVTIIIKTFIIHCLVAVQLRNTSGQQGYAPTHNIYNVLSTRNGNTDTNNNETAMTITQTVAAAATGSMLGNTYTHTNFPVHSEVSITINQLLANQAALFQQMAALSFNAPAQRSNMFQAPPIQTLTILGIPPSFAIGGATLGRSALGRRCRECGRGCSGCMQTPFTYHMAGRGNGGFLAGASGGIPPFQQGGAFPQMGRHRMNPPHSNIMKKYATWNACYSCGFDIEDGHTLATCPTQWRKATNVDATSRRLTSPTTNV
jgi:hypothetical protein